MRLLSTRRKEVVAPFETKRDEVVEIPVVVPFPVMVSEVPVMPWRFAVPFTVREEVAVKVPMVLEEERSAPVTFPVTFPVKFPVTFPVTFPVSVPEILVATMFVAVAVPETIKFEVDAVPPTRKEFVMYWLVLEEFPEKYASPTTSRAASVVVAVPPIKTWLVVVERRTRPCSAM